MTRSKKTSKPSAAAPGFYIYVGPTITGVIQTGHVFRVSSREEAAAAIPQAVERYPLIKSLIVSGDTYPEDRIKVKTPGNLLYVKYQQLLSRKK